MWKVKETLELPIVWHAFVLAVHAELTLLQFAEAARQLKITPAQTVLSWLRQRGVVVLPKSTDPGRIKENVKGKWEGQGCIYYTD